MRRTGPGGPPARPSGLAAERLGDEPVDLGRDIGCDRVRAIGADRRRRRIAVGRRDRADGRRSTAAPRTSRRCRGRASTRPRSSAPRTPSRRPRAAIASVAIEAGSSPASGAAWAMVAETRSASRATGILNTKTSPPRAIAERRMASSTARSVVITKRVIDGSVTVTGPPAATWRANSSSAEPREPSTLPKRTLANVVR